MEEQTDGKLLTTAKLRTLGVVIYHHLKYIDQNVKFVDTDEPHFDT